MTASNKTTKSAEAFETMASMNPENFKLGYEKFAESMSMFTDFQKNSMEALMASAGAFAKGVEKLTAEQSAFVKASFEETVANAKTAATSKNVQEALDVNAEFMRGSFEKNLGQINKVANIWVETAKDTAEPLTERYGELVEKIQTYRP